ncbi:bestrophin family protein [Mesonia ostreae]|uniref:Bestrophin family ion channel n=1 Tax=Mesonia ostreae TaxID=861110 RepID=A0ABU2KMG1_9FLAO|nr:bestrophin family ion channel [Mesonia ostreae]MDT0295911.1 bestrophin family ion channel [Mesonia ostreae]
MDTEDIFYFVILSTVPVILYTVFRWYWLHLPWLPISLIGTAVAFIIGFKNNASYDRLWEARKVWGGIVNTSRSLTIMLNDYVNNEHAKKILSDQELFEIRKTFILRHIAWMSSLRHALRTPKSWEAEPRKKTGIDYRKHLEIREQKYSLEEELKGYLSEEEKDYVLSKKNKQAACLNLQSKHLSALKTEGYVWEFAHLEIEKMFVELFTLQGKVERIKNFPYPRQFATLNKFFVWIFVILLPFGMMNEFDKIGIIIVESMEQYKPYPNSGFHYLIELMGHYFIWFTVPFSVIISWVFNTMERVGEASENPFEGEGNDVPITTMSRDIEIDIRQMIGDHENNIPKPEPEKFNTQL